MNQTNRMKSLRIKLGAAALAMGILCGAGGGHMVQAMAQEDTGHKTPVSYTRSYEDVNVTYASVDEL